MDVEGLKTRADGLASCLKNAGPGVLNAEMVKEIGNAAISIYSDSLKRRSDEAAERQKRSGEAEDAGEEDEDEVELRNNIMNAAGALMEHHPDIFAAQLMPTYLQLVQQKAPAGNPQEDRKLAYSIASDMIRYLGQRVVEQWPSFLPQIVADIANEDAELRGTACYAVSWAARDQAFAPMAAEVAGKLAELVTATRARPKKKSEIAAQVAADNALSGLIELLLNHQSQLAASEPQLWAAWLNGLPVQVDAEEGCRNNKVLMRLVQQENPHVLGQGGANLPAVLKVLVEGYKTEMTEEETDKDIGKLMLALGQAKLEGAAGAMSEKQKKKLLRIHTEASANP